jgi:hypothetical protein
VLGEGDLLAAVLGKRQIGDAVIHGFSPVGNDELSSGRHLDDTDERVNES